MTYVVTEDCIAAKHTDCVAVCPVDCFYEGENILAINPDECIDCGAREAECPIDVIKPDMAPDMAPWIAFNRKYARLWPNITEMGVPPADAEVVTGKPNKLRDLFSEQPGEGS